MYQQTYNHQNTEPSATSYLGNSSELSSSSSSSLWGDLGLPQQNVPEPKPVATKQETSVNKSKTSFQELLNAGEEKAV